jgi:hypothetical protein
MKMAVQYDSLMTYSCSFLDRVVEVELVLVVDLRINLG